MPAAAPVTVNNGTSDVVLTPESITGTHVQYQDLSQAVLAQRTLMHFDRPNGNGTSQVRRTVRVNLPYLETVDGEEVVKMATFKGELISPASAPKSVRSQLRELGSNALQTAVAEAVCDNPEWVF